jgi:hypothetical protein
LREAISYFFTPLESPGIYAGDAINRQHQLFIKEGVKAPSFLTGFTGELKKFSKRATKSTNFIFQRGNCHEENSFLILIT